MFQFFPREVVLVPLQRPWPEVAADLQVSALYTRGKRLTDIDVDVALRSRSIQLQPLRRMNRRPGFLEFRGELQAAAAPGGAIAGNIRLGRVWRIMATVLWAGTLIAMLSSASDGVTANDDFYALAGMFALSLMAPRLLLLGCVSEKQAIYEVLERAAAADAA